MEDGWGDEIRFNPNEHHCGAVFVVIGGGIAAENDEGQLVWLANIPPYLDAEVGDLLPRRADVKLVDDPCGNQCKSG